MGDGCKYTRPPPRVPPPIELYHKVRSAKRWGTLLEEGGKELNNADSDRGFNSTTQWSEFQANRGEKSTVPLEVRGKLDV